MYGGSYANYKVTSKTHYDPDGRTLWSITFPSDPSKSAVGTFHLYESPTGTSTKLSSLESVEFHPGFRSSDYPSAGGGYGSYSNYIITSKTYYSQGRTEWYIKFPTDTTLSPTGHHYFYSATGTLTKMEIVRFPVHFRPHEYPANGFYTITSINYYNSRGMMEWVVNFPSNPASSPTGYHFVYDMAGTFRKLDILTYRPLEPTISVPYMRYTVTSSTKY